MVTFPLCISWVYFLEISATVDGVFDGLKSFWIVSPLCSKCRISPDVHKSIRHSNAFKCSLDLDFWDGFCSNKLGIIIIALNAVSFKDESCSYSFISLVVSDDDRRALTSDVTAYVNKNPYRVVQFLFKAWFSKVDDVKRVIGVKPVWAYTSHHLVSENFRLFPWPCSISGVSTPLISVKPVWGA